MKLNSEVLMLLLMSMAFGTACIPQLASADGVVKPLKIGLYWDEECTNPVSSIFFGIIAKGGSRNVTLWLKNNSMEKGLISWGSANFNPSSNGISETWERKVGDSVYIASWHKRMKTLDLWEIRYTLHVAHDTQVGNYSWDLTVCLIASEEITCLSVTCVLTVTQ